MTANAKLFRKEIYDIVIYSEGAFTIKELYQLPMYQITEIVNSFTEKNKREQEAIDAQSGKKTF